MRILAGPWIYTQSKQKELTPQEIKIVKGLIKGLRYKQIAHEIGITEGTVKLYLYRLRDKTGCETNCQLVAMFAVKLNEAEKGEEKDGKTASTNPAEG
jgi:DNA-binding NarL/FixJ family response regulator